jgi:DnaJ-class molecular chaperone
MELYDILSLSPDASNEDIKRAYKRLAKVYHPDKPTGNTEQFQKINYAYNILINDTTRCKYNDLKKPTKSKLTNFLADFFNKQNNIKKFLNLSEVDLNKIIENIECYDFNDIIGLFNKNIIPTKKNTIIDCSDTETPYWDEISAEYYSINNLPIKYHMYNENNIRLDLKCTLDEIVNENIRKIKIKRKQDNSFIENSFYFKCSHPIIVFNNGGDNDGHLIIYLSLPDKYTWGENNIYYNVDINLYQYIYGLDNFKTIYNINLNNYIPYKDGNIINIKYIDTYMLSIKLNIVFNDNEKNKEILYSLCN